jgi:hypothetical protein
MKKTPLIVAVAGLAATVTWTSCKTSMAGDYSEEKADLPQRKLIGVPAPYPTEGPDGVAAAARDFLARRALGWTIFRKVIAPVSLKGADLSLLRLPALLTWYEPSEFRRIFSLAWAGRRGSEDWERSVDAALQSYPEQRGLESNASYRSLLAKLQAARDDREIADALAAGLGRGRGKTLFNGPLLRDYLINVDGLLECRDDHPVIDGDNPAEQELARLASEPRDRNKFDGCFKQREMQREAVAIKLQWREVRCGNDRQADIDLTAFDTTAAGLEAAFRAGTWSDSVGRPVKAKCSDLFTVRVPRTTGTGYSDFALLGLHITTKELPEWTWVTVWWAPDSASDFGADRPDLAEGRPADGEYFRRWRNYKMCVVTAFDELDDLLRRAGPLPVDMPAGSRAVVETMRGVHTALGDTPAQDDAKVHTWCSNPYIERNEGESDSSCIGCHQHAGPGITFDAGGRHDRREQRVNNFLADFLWSWRDFVEQLAVAKQEAEDEAGL